MRILPPLGLALASLVLASFPANLIPNGSFESGAWGGNAWRGKGSVALVAQGGPEGTPCLLLTGLSPDAAVQAISARFEFSPGKAYALQFAYRSTARATVDLRWKGGGIVYELRKPAATWLTLHEALARKDAGGILYAKGLGAAEGRQNLLEGAFRFPEGVAEVTAYLTLSGEGTLRLAALQLEEAAPRDRADGGNAMDRDEADRLLIRKDGAVEATRAPASRFKLDLHEVALRSPVVRDPGPWPSSATDLRIRGDQFVRGDKPVFLFGVESVVVHPWLYRLLGMDLVHMQDPCPTAVMRTRKTNDTVEVWWEPYRWMEAQLRQLLGAGLSVYIQPFEEKQDVMPNVPLSKEFPALFVNRSHFLNYRFEEPDGKRLRENMWKSLLDISRRYPIFAYELFNEVRYMDYSPANLAAFRASMAAKYGAIGAANAAWGSAFPSYEAMTPPEKSSAAGGNLMGLSPKDFSRPLWIDWQKYIETVFSNHMAEVSRLVRSIDAGPAAYRTIQSVCDLHQDYSGGGGVLPSHKILSEDFYGDEASGGNYISQSGGDDLHEIKRMLKPLMLGDAVSFLSAGKPVLDIECQVQGYGRSPAAGSRVVELHGAWRFSEDNGKAGAGRGQETPGFDDAGWKEIAVPGFWGTQGFPDCRFGWYRKRFVLGPAMAGSRLFLNGSKLSDRATVWVNGKQILQTREWNESFAVELTALLRPGAENVIALAIANEYRDAGMYWGGIRGYLSLDDRPYPPYAPLSAGQMRSFFWEKAVHGKNGVIMSYAYDPEATRLSMFNPRKVSAEALQAIPSVKKELEGVADLVLGEHRRPADVALMYSFESGRGRVYKGYEEWLAAPATKDLLDWYAALTFALIPTDVANNAALLSGACDRHRALLLRMCERALPGTLEKLEAYVRGGGILLLDHGSLALDDERHTRLDLGRLVGARIGEAFTNARAVQAGEMLGEGFTTRPREFDGQTGRAVELAGASALLSYSDGRPAVTTYALGKGRVYYFAAEWPEGSFQPFLASLLARHGIANPALSLSLPPGAKLGRHTEGRLFSRSGDSVLYLHNWGDGPAPMTVKLPALPDGDFRVRDLKTGAPFAGGLVSAASLKRGLSIALEGQDPLVLLLEPANKAARALPKLPAAHTEALRLLRPSPPAAIRVLVNASRAETVSRVRMLTAVRLLEANGFQLETGLEELKEDLVVAGEGIRTEKLSAYQIVTTLGNATGDRKFRKEEIETLRQFVSNGGSLLLGANFFVGPHYWQENWGSKGPLAKAFGVELGHQNAVDSNAGLDGFAFHPRVDAVAGHPITTAVTSVQTLGMSVLKATRPDAFVLLRASPRSTPPGAALALAFEYGKGRVVVLGDSKWLTPDLLGKEDNAQFCLNLFQWLAHRERAIAALPAAEKARLTDTRLD